MSRCVLHGKKDNIYSLKNTITLKVQKQNKTKTK